jgi:hypothetical protein
MSDDALKSLALGGLLVFAIILMLRRSKFFRWPGDRHWPGE